MNDDHAIAILERLEDRFARFAEAMADVPKDIKDIKERLDSLESDMKVVKAVATDHSKELNDHDRRITILENA